MKPVAAVPLTEVGDPAFDSADPIEIAPLEADIPRPACPKCGGSLRATGANCSRCGSGSDASRSIPSDTANGADGIAFSRPWRTHPVAWACSGLAAGIVLGGLRVGAIVGLGENYNIAIAVAGLGIGYAVSFVAAGYRGWLSGCIAAVLTVVTMLGTHQVAASILVDRTLDLSSLDTVTDEDLRAHLAHALATDRRFAGRVPPRPSGVARAAGTSADSEFPPDLVAERDREWDALSGDDREKLREGVRDGIESARRVLRQSQAASYFGFGAFFWTGIGTYLAYLIAQRE